MRRRLVVLAAFASTAVALTLQARAQQPAKPKLVAVLALGSEQTNGKFVELMKQRLRELGWVQGANVAYEARWADGDPERLPQLARELVALEPNVIWTGFTPIALAARQATGTIPIVVAASADPVGSGLAKSLGRPGGNVTGLSNVNADIGPKLLELLRIALPRLVRVAVLWNPGNATHPLILKGLRGAAESVNVTLVTAEATTAPGIEQALLRLSHENVDAVILAADGLYFTHRQLISELLARHRMPAAMAAREYLGTLGLLSYGQSSEEAVRRSASYVDRILRGARPADLPIEQPTRFELVINLKAAKALGIAIPQSLLRRADEVLE